MGVVVVGVVVVVLIVVVVVVEVVVVIEVLLLEPAMVVVALEWATASEEFWKATVSWNDTALCRQSLAGRRLSALVCVRISSDVGSSEAITRASWIPTSIALQFPSCHATATSANKDLRKSSLGKVTVFLAP